MTVETLGQKQERFSRHLGMLITMLSVSGYGVRLKEVYRSDEQAAINALGRDGRQRLCALLSANGFDDLAAKIANNTGDGIARSLHCDGLAADLILTRNGTLVPQTQEGYRHVGHIWHSFGEDFIWGGGWGNDIYHVSITHGGRK